MFLGGLSKLTVSIGITCNRVGYENRLSLAYVKAVAKAGAVPLLLPTCTPPFMWREMLKKVDALILSGGGDPDAFLYGCEARPEQGYVQPDRDRMELYLARYSLHTKLPLLGICRGAQIVAIAQRGALYQDITNIAAVQHLQKAPRNYPIHQVKVYKNTLLYQITGQRSFRVNSFHHQAIKNVGPGMVVSAVAPDGIIEAVEVQHHPFALGVQWHPEWLFNCQHAATLFIALVKAASSQPLG
jgi:putative glutamine amidotransferase